MNKKQRRYLLDAYSIYCLESLESVWTPVPLNRHPLLDADFAPTIFEALDRLEDLRKQFKTEKTRDQKYLLGILFSAKNVFSYRGLVQPVEFKFLREGSGRAGPYTKSMFTFDLILPFEKDETQDENCVSVKDLPLFYRSKGEK